LIVYLPKSQLIDSPLRLSLAQLCVVSY